MTTAHFLQEADAYLHKLCHEFPNRRVGSEGNQAATDFFASIVSSYGFETTSPPFDCMDWRCDGVQLLAEGSPFEAFASPYSVGRQATAPLVVVSTDEALEVADITNKIVLLRGDITGEQLMPKNFPFYNPERHGRIIHLLETKKPEAIVAATSRDLQMVGGAYPFPLFEDGDFDIPSVYMKDVEGERLAASEGKDIALKLQALRSPSTGCNVIGRKGTDATRRMVLFAHIDAKMGTPGASDNATGVVVLLLLAELLSEHSGALGVELVAMNGEDYYSSPGEQQYLAMNGGRFDEIVLGINLDGVGYHKGRVAYSLYECPSEMADSIRQVFSPYEDLMEGESWYQGDHALFLMNQVPAVAITSELLAELMAEITHTPKDTPEIVDTSKLVTVARAIHDLVHHLDRHLPE